MSGARRETAIQRLESIRRRGHPPRVAACIVTWNRADDVNTVLGALSRQMYPVSQLDVIVIDNASTDGTAEQIVKNWRPDRIVQNPTPAAHEPAFEITARDGEPNRGGFASLTLVRNAHNHGGCGGFNTGFLTVERVLAQGAHPPEFVWLVDDDIDLPDDTLVQLVHLAREKPRAGLIGSRTCDIGERWRTIESTIYFDRETGLMRDDAPAHDPRRADHDAWSKAVGGPKGGGGYSGAMPVDVVSACSMLARWSDVREVGYWDKRFFIYCDDADWCLRFAKAGREVWLNLDAVVFHTPWHHKLTPARMYYAKRNLLWMIEKAIEPPSLRRVWGRRANHDLRESRKAALHRRLTSAEIIRRNVADAIRWRRGDGGGKLEMRAPQPQLLAEAMADARAMRGARIAFVTPGPREIEMASKFRDDARGMGVVDPQWIELVRNDAPGAFDAPEGVRRVVYSKKRRSKIRRQTTLLLRAPKVTVIFDNHCDFPLLTGRWTLHIDSSKPGIGTLESHAISRRIGFGARWLWTAARARMRAMTLKPFVSGDRFG